MRTPSAVSLIWTWIALASVSLTAPSAAQTSRTGLTPGTVVISNVGLVPMTSDTLIQGTTVLIRDGRIAAVARDGSIRLPSGARRIDGRGKYLIPGLADMHVHLYSDGETPDSLAGDELGVMLANGVTAIRLMIGTPEHLELRRRIESGGMLGPQLWVASPQFIGTPDGNSRVVTTPTLTMFKEAFGLGQPDQLIRARPDWGMMPAKERSLYLNARDHYWANPPTEARRRHWIAVRNQLVKAISDSGGKIMAGSDTPEWFLGYGFTLHRELESLVAAGLTPYQALAAATRNPAEFLHALREWGTIEPGKRADLVLLSANPLEDIRNTTRIEGVLIGGRWLEPAVLRRMVLTATQRLGAGPAG
jgi:hypothetical protein